MIRKLDDQSAKRGVREQSESGKEAQAIWASRQVCSKFSRVTTVGNWGAKEEIAVDFRTDRDTRESKSRRTRANFVVGEAYSISEERALDEHQPRSFPGSPAHELATKPLRAPRSSSNSFAVNPTRYDSHPPTSFIMQFKVIAFITALVASAAAQTGCVTILDGAVCPVGYEECGPLPVGETHCCPGLGGPTGAMAVPTTARVNASPHSARAEGVPSVSRVASTNLRSFPTNRLEKAGIMKGPAKIIVPVNRKANWISEALGLGNKPLRSSFRCYQEVSPAGLDIVRRRPVIAQVVRKVIPSGLQHTIVMDPV
ncbi:hypothetical protein FB451DRAFT_1163761 [Mycena latifolia]|nr:hypothetical protein FB451DRAFT_1163761 [Mycena latifolia]